MNALMICNQPWVFVQGMIAAFVVWFFIGGVVCLIYRAVEPSSFGEPIEYIGAATLWPATVWIMLTD